MDGNRQQGRNTGQAGVLGVVRQQREAK